MELPCAMSSQSTFIAHCKLHIAHCKKLAAFGLTFSRHGTSSCYEFAKHIHCTLHIVKSLPPLGLLPHGMELLHAMSSQSTFIAHCKLHIAHCKKLAAFGLTSSRHGTSLCYEFAKHIHCTLQIAHCTLYKACRLWAYFLTAWNFFML